VMVIIPIRFKLGDSVLICEVDLVRSIEVVVWMEILMVGGPILVW